jgi:hypothetical protein
MKSSLRVNSGPVPRLLRERRGDQSASWFCPLPKLRPYCETRNLRQHAEIAGNVMAAVVPPVGV